MVEHTPSFWSWIKVNGDQRVTEHTLKGPDVLCRFWFDKPASVDAKLIAAAPELLELLKKLVKQANWDCRESYAKESAEELIKKIEKKVT